MKHLNLTHLCLSMMVCFCSSVGYAAENITQSAKDNAQVINAINSQIGNISYNIASTPREKAPGPEGVVWSLWTILMGVIEQQPKVPPSSIQVTIPGFLADEKEARERILALTTANAKFSEFVQTASPVQSWQLVGSKDDGTGKVYDFRAITAKPLAGGYVLSANISINADGYLSFFKFRIEQLKTCLAYRKVNEYEVEIVIPPGGTVRIKTGRNADWEQQVIAKADGRDFIRGPGEKSESIKNEGIKDITVSLTAEHKKGGTGAAFTWDPSKVKIHGFETDPIGRCLVIGWDDSGGSTFRNAMAKIYALDLPFCE